MHIAVLDANTDDSAFAARHPDEGGKFRSLLAPVRPGWQISGVPVKDGAMPARIDAFDGYIVSGSPASVHDPRPWIAPLAGLIRDAVDRGIPVFGACFGHQMIARALGGQVGPSPGGWVLGRVETDLAPPWEGERRRLSLYAAHREQVLALPPGAVATGRTEGCELAAFALGRTVWTTQYHPEMTPDFVVDLVEEYGPALPAPVTARARASLLRPADEGVIAELIACFFETALSPEPPAGPSR